MILYYGSGVWTLVQASKTIHNGPKWAKWAVLGLFCIPLSVFWSSTVSFGLYKCPMGPHRSPEAAWSGWNSKV